MSAAAEIAWTRVGPRAIPEAGPADRVLDAALAASPALDALLNGPQPVLLVVNDPCRATPTSVVLAAVARRFAARGATPEFDALVAAGTHTFGAAERAAFERATFRGCGLRVRSVVWHDAGDASALVDLGCLRIHRVLAAAARVLAVGSVEPHYFAGATGAHKTVTIGCLARADIERNHAAALHPASDVLALRGNPVFEEIEGMMARLTKPPRDVVAINVVARGERVVAAAAGDALTTLAELLPVVRRVYAHEPAAPVDVLRLRVPPPLGRSFYQADKALKNNHRAVRDRGGIVLEADCPEGIGQDAFMDLLRRAPTYADARRCVDRDRYRLGDHKAVKLRHLTDPAARGVRVALVSRFVSDVDAGVLGFQAAPDVPAALAWMRANVTPCARGMIVDDAGQVCVVPAGGAA